ncbi:MAG: amino acid adenylation domain-containing protein [Catenulispora sp.]
MSRLPGLQEDTMALVGNRHALPADPLVHRRFAEHAKRDPDRTALVCGPEVRTYAELDASANRFAHLLAGRGIGPGSLVGVCIDRSVELMIAILGVLKAGAAYVPLDPTHPRDRLRLMVSQLPDLRLIAAGPSTAELVRDAGRPWLDVTAVPELAELPGHDPEVAVTGDDLCYAVFTSGSTGTPKAAAIRHEGWYNLLAWLEAEYTLGTGSSNLMLSSFGFDISQRSLLTPLFTGAALHLLPSRSFDLARAYRIIGEQGIRTLHCAPSTLYLLLDREQETGGSALTGLHYVFIGGEPLSAKRVRAWATRPDNRCLLLHQYGVAECTDVASSYRMTDFPAHDGAALPAGEAVYNTRIHIMDQALAELPDGEVGEICISGTSVGAGYLNASEADHAKFTAATVDGEQIRLYRTGDYGRLSDGRLVVAGRLDAQVKIRGMRIDLGDVEHAVAARPGVRAAAVVAAPDGADELELVAFVVPGQESQESLDLAALRADLVEALPRNMVPQRIVALPDLPLNPTGKGDRRALTERAAGAHAGARP